MMSVSPADICILYTSFFFLQLVMFKAIKQIRVVVITEKRPLSSSA